MKRAVKVEDMSRPAEPLVEIQGSDLMPLPVVSDADIQNPTLKGLTEEQKRQYEGLLRWICCNWHPSASKCRRRRGVHQEVSRRTRKTLSQRE